MNRLNLWFDRAKFILPVALWFFIFGSYWIGKPCMTTHGMDYYHIVKYFMDNLTHGSFPLWDPFRNWGKPDDFDNRFIGEFNPFMWLYVIFSKAGIPLQLSFLYYAMLYYFVGVVGFYFLAKRIFQDKNLAWVSFVLLLFSSVGFTVFNNFCITLLFVPVVWFFYFLVAFCREPRKHFLLGLTFSAMIILITYMPFYFLTIWAAFVLGYAALFPGQSVKIISKSFRFFKENKFLMVFCLFSVILSAMPGWQWNQEALRGEYVLSWRHEGSPVEHSAGVNIGTVNAGGVVGPVTFQGLFSDLDKSVHLMSYVSIFVYIVFLLSIINNLNRRLILLFGVAFFLILIAMADMAPVHRFLYDHVFFFKLFRNIFYFFYMSIPIVILFVVDQWRLFLEHKPSGRRQKFFMVLFLLTVHLGFIFFLLKMEDVIWTSYLAVVLSLLLLIVFFLAGPKIPRRVFDLLFIGVIVLQPGEVFTHAVQNSLSAVEWFPQERFFSHFSFVRRFESDELLFKGPTEGIQDHSGIVPWKYTGLKYSYLLQKEIPSDVLERYTRYKFFVYDHVQPMEEQSVNFKRIQEAFAGGENLAFVFSDSRHSEERSDEESKREEILRFAQNDERAPQALRIENNSSNFIVERFDVNSIRFKTHFDGWKFLVYNDSFHKNWQATINGKKTEILRANYAFKGIWLPPGENTVYFRHGSFGLAFFNYFMLGFFYLFFIYLLWSCHRADRKETAYV
ncbi:MAG TPA: hypothetical protein VJA17_00780 [Candidatus Omnitrophota bacterium]|nr:hypothetical protein [Candidatus Omnitrophota bacterium]